ncbi:MAG TPA: tetratricopeptide repeat protein [Enhygromyxa sp.]|nr:tetratricopeptide repeat protein [Enhygromyxa sp.]
MVDSRHNPPRDLIGDIHAQQRRKLFRRVALGVALFVVLLLIGIAVKLLAERHDRDGCLEDARQGFALGTSADLELVVESVQGCLDRHENDALLLGAMALTRAQLLAEYGIDPEGAHGSVAALDNAKQTTHDGELARVMIALDDGELAAARELLPTVAAMNDEQSIAPNHEVWVGGMLAITDPEADLDAAIDTVAEIVQSDPSISLRRLLAALHMRAGSDAAALEELARAREQSVTHYGLAADDALYNAVLRQKLTGVADVADQLLGGGFEIAPRDRAHALLARGVVSVQSGEIEAGMKLVAEAWDALPGWDKLSRTLALEMAMEAGDGERARKWIDEAGLRTPESDIYEAWVKLVEGDIMAALADLALLPQKHPHVQLLQGLALVEQNRWAEAQEWLERADKWLPGRIDVEVARARVEIRTGDPEAARRKLAALAEEEPFAPRAWTGLGEANVAVAYRDVDRSAPLAAQKPDPSALREARRAFKKAVETERRPAEAYLQLAELTDLKRREDPKLASEVLDLLDKAVVANEKLPRYPERKALYLAELGRRGAAMTELRALIDRPGVSWKVSATLAQLALEQLDLDEIDQLPEAFDSWIEQAQKLGAPPRELDLLQARAALERGKPADAAPKLAALLASNPQDIDARIYHVRALMELHDRDTALAEVKRGIGAVPDELSGRLYLEWSTIMSRGGKRRPAAIYAGTGWRKIKDHPGSTVHELLIAAEQAVRMYQRDQKPKPAAVVGRELTDLVPTHSDAWVIRAGAELRSNRGSDAKASAERAIELDENNARAHEILGHMWLRFGSKERAKEAFEKALELGKGTPQEAAYKKNLEGL